MSIVHKQNTQVSTVWRHDRHEQIASRQVITSLRAACATIGLGRNWHTFTSIRCSNGNVSCSCTCLHHHANRQMVERRLFAIYSQAGRTILERCCAKNANTSIFPDDPRHRTSNCVKRRFPAAQPPRQRRDEEKYWTQRVSTGATSDFLSFQLTNQRRRSN